MLWSKAIEKAKEDEGDDVAWVIPLQAITIMVEESRLICFTVDLKGWLASITVFIYFVKDISSLDGVVNIVLLLCYATVILVALFKSMKGVVLLGKVLHIKDDAFTILLVTGTARIIGTVLSVTTKFFLVLFLLPSYTLMRSYSDCQYSITTKISAKLLKLFKLYDILKKWVIRMLFKLYDILTKSTSKVVPDNCFDQVVVA